MSVRAVRLTDVDIDNALTGGHLETVFQPVVLLRDRSILRHEMFVRWDHPGLGALPPGAFLSFFESQGRIGELTRYVLAQGLTARADSEANLSLNLSVSDLYDSALVGDLTNALNEAGASPDCLTLECPQLPTDVPPAEQTEIYGRLAEAGCPLSIEVRSRTTDALQAFDPFPFAEIKVGGSSILRFVKTSRGGPGMAALADLIAFAKSKAARIVAVGIEDAAAIDALNRIGVDAGQGNALGRTGPLGAPEAAVTEQDVVPAQIPPTPLDLSQAEADGAAASRTRKARLAAARRAALRRFQAARQSARLDHPPLEIAEAVDPALEQDAADRAKQTARALQERLADSFVGPITQTAQQTAAPSAIPDVENFSDGLRVDGYTVSSAQGAIRATGDEAPAPRRAEVASRVSAILDGLGDEIAARVEATPPRNNDGGELLEEEFRSPEDILDAHVASAPEIQQDFSPVPRSDDTPAPVAPAHQRRGAVPAWMPSWMPMILARRYRITHFWPRSWQRRSQAAA